MSEKETEGPAKPFAFRVKVGDYEVEIKGERAEVLETVRDLQSVMADVQKAFNNVKPKTVATLTIKKEPSKEEAPAQKFPKVAKTGNCGDAVLRVLETDWGKWRPRTMNELREALKANGMEFSGRMLAGVMLGSVRSGKVRRWKTDADTVYILAEEESLK